MCLACEQDAMWYAYLRRRGLITPDGQFVEEPPSLFVADPAEPAQAASPQAETPAENKQDDGREVAEENKFSCDDPSTG